MTVTAIIIGLYGQEIYEEGSALNHWGRMKGLAMLTVVMKALVQQEKMVTVITCFYYVFELTEFPRTGMCTTPQQ